GQPRCAFLSALLRTAHCSCGPFYLPFITLFSAAQKRVASPDRKGLISREEHEKEMEQLKNEIRECRETIKNQQHLLQQQIIVGNDDTSAILQDCYLLEDQERLQEEWRLFHEQKKNFEKERRNFTEAAIRLGHERKVFEEDRAMWLKHQFLNMSLFCDRKSAEYCQPQSAFSSKSSNFHLCILMSFIS
ncbi:unnamed protein product, partial [Staurois parvus]